MGGKLLHAGAAVGRLQHGVVLHHQRLAVDLHDVGIVLHKQNGIAHVSRSFGMVKRKQEPSGPVASSSSVPP